MFIHASLLLLLSAAVLLLLPLYCRCMSECSGRAST
jgi:hypothetical protein